LGWWQWAIAPQNSSPNLVLPPLIPSLVRNLLLQSPDGSHQLQHKTLPPPPIVLPACIAPEGWLRLVPRQCPSVEAVHPTQQQHGGKGVSESVWGQVVTPDILSVFRHSCCQSTQTTDCPGSDPPLAYVPPNRHSIEPLLSQVCRC
jgi:hypothetical protein